MDWRGNFRSRLVALLKVALPLAALGLLSTLFLFSRGTEPGDSLPYADVDIEALAREPRMSAPNYATVTSDGAVLTITAETARSDISAPDTAEAGAVRMRLVTPDGMSSETIAAEARLDSRERLLLLSGGVEIIHGSGYTLHTGALSAALSRTHVESLGPVEAEGPAGRIAAGKMRLALHADGENYVLLFKDGVRLVYEPAAHPDPAANAPDSSRPDPARPDPD